MIIFGQKLTVRQLISLITLIFLVVSIPILIYLVKTEQILKSKAAEGTRIEFVDQSGNLINETTTLAAKIKLTYVLAPASPPGTFSNNPITKKALAVIFDPVLSNGLRLHQKYGWQDPYVMVPQIVDIIRNSSGGYLNYQVVETVDGGWPAKQGGFRYNEQTFNDCISGIDCYVHTEADYAQLFSDYNVCSRVSSGQLDEVWVYQAPAEGFDEYAFKLPGDKFPYNTPSNYWFYAGRVKNIPDCGKTIFVMGWNFERGVAEAVHSYGHRIENALGLTVGGGDWQGCAGTSDFDRFSCIQKGIGTGPITVPGCGNVHYPPNGSTDYDYGNFNPVADGCDSFTNYPFSSPTLVTRGCQAWGCEQLGFLSWWMTHLPRQEGVAPNGNLRNWWKYIGDFDNGVAEAKGAAPPSFPTHFRVANSVAELGVAPEQPFDSNGKIIDWTLPSGNGPKIVYIQFKVDGVWQNPLSAQIILNIPLPSPSPSATITTSPSANPSCMPRPACLDVQPRCLIPEPQQGWCLNGSPSPSPSSKPAPLVTPRASPNPSVSLPSLIPSSTLTPPALAISSPPTPTASPSLAPQATFIPTTVLPPHHNLLTTSSSSPTPNIFDLNKDRVVNTVDVAILLSDWRRGGIVSRSDFNSDKQINTFDYALLRGNL